MRIIWRAVHSLCCESAPRGLFVMDEIIHRRSGTDFDNIRINCARGPLKNNYDLCLIS